MKLTTWIKSLFSRRPQRAALVPYYDIPSRRLVHIPASELRPDCVQARVEGVDGIVWIMTQDVQEGEIRHPPFDEDIRAYIRDIQTAFAEHRNLSFEEWEDGFRRDADAVREIAGFSYAADVYRLFTANEKSAERRREVYRLLIACMTTSPESVWHIVQLAALSRAEAERIVKRFYGGQKADDSTPS